MYYSVLCKIQMFTRGFILRMDGFQYRHYTERHIAKNRENHHNNKIKMKTK